MPHQVDHALIPELLQGVPLLGVGKDGVGRDPAQEGTMHVGRNGVLRVEHPGSQIVTVALLGQQLQRHVVAVYLVPAHGDRDVLVKGPAPQPHHPLPLEARLAQPLGLPLLEHQHRQVIGRGGITGLQHATHLIPVDSHRHVAPLLGDHRQRPLVGHDAGDDLVAIGLVDGAHYVQIDATPIPLAKTRPVIAIDIEGIGPTGPAEQQQYP